MRGEQVGPFILGLILALGLGLQVAVRTAGAVREGAGVRGVAVQEQRRRDAEPPGAAPVRPRRDASPWVEAKAHDAPRGKDDRQAASGRRHGGLHTV